MQVAVERFDPVEHGLRELDRRNLSGLEKMSDLRQLEVVQLDIVHLRAVAAFGFGASIP